MLRCKSSGWVSLLERQSHMANDSTEMGRKSCWDVLLWGLQASVSPCAYCSPSSLAVTSSPQPISLTTLRGSLVLGFRR